MARRVGMVGRLLRLLSKLLFGMVGRLLSQLVELGLLVLRTMGWQLLLKQPARVHWLAWLLPLQLQILRMMSIYETTGGENSLASLRYGLFVLGGTDGATSAKKMMVMVMYEPTNTNATKSCGSSTTRRCRSASSEQSTRW
jgi:hypothetical protein